jgi:CysZ protein
VVSDFSRGFTCALAGVRQLSHPALRPFVIVPLFINLVLFAAVIWVATGVFSAWLDSLFSWLPDWLGFLDWLLWPLFILTVLLMVFYLFTVVANLLGSPFNGLLAEKTERLLNPGAEFPESPPLWQDMLVAPWLEFRKLAYVLLWAVPLLLLFLVPGVNAFAPLLWWSFGAWVLALQYMEYPLSNHMLPLAVQRDLMARRRMLALGFGTAIMLLTLIPVVNFVVMPAAVIGATRLWVRHLQA